MARVSLIEPENATPEVKEIYEKALRGKPGNAQKALAHRPEMLKNFLPFYASVGRSLDRKLYEMIYLRASFINGCHYCQQHHVASSKRVGLTAEDWKALKDGHYSRFTEKEQTARLQRVVKAANQFVAASLGEIHQYVHAENAVHAPHVHRAREIHGRKRNHPANPRLHLPGIAQLCEVRLQLIGRNIRHAAARVRPSLRKLQCLPADVRRQNFNLPCVCKWKRVGHSYRDRVRFLSG